MSVERKYFQELCDKDLRDVDWLELENALREITSGITCFGEREEWRVWFHYILANLTERAFEPETFSRWSEALTSAFMVNYPDGAALEPYPGFLEDVFNTLVVSPMHPSLWEGDEIVLEHSLLFFARGLGRWRWNEAVSGELSALLFFCLKYLPAQAIERWIVSILHLPSTLYHAQFLLWLVGSRDVLSGRHTSPAEFPETSAIEISWDISHSVALRAPGDHRDDYQKCTFLPPGNVDALVAALERHLTRDLVLEWLNKFAEIPALKEEMLGLGRGEDFLGMFDVSGQFVLYAA